MTTGTKISAQGTTFTFNSQVIDNVISMTGFGSGQAADKDRTTLASTAKEFAPGLQDNGEFSLEVFRDNDGSGQAAVMAALAAQSTQTMVIDFPSSTLDQATFTCYVKSISSEGKVDSDITGTITFRITGAIVWA